MPTLLATCFRLFRTGCAWGHPDRGVLGSCIVTDSSQGKPERTDRERRKRRAAGNSSIQLFLGVLASTSAIAQSPAPVAKNSEAEIRAVGDAFEAMMLQRLYEQMRQSAQLLAPGADNPFAPSSGEEIFRGMKDQAMLQGVAERRPLGISDMVVRQLGGGKNHGGPGVP